MIQQEDPGEGSSGMLLRESIPETLRWMIFATKSNRMTKKELTEFTDQELLNEAKKMKSFSVVNSFFIGFLIGIIIYSVLKSSWGMLTLIPLYLAYKIINDPRNKRSGEIEKILKDRNLK